jgi:hypothetical protein
MAVIFDQRGRPIDHDNPFPTTVSGSNLVAAGEKTDAAVTDASIQTAGFHRIEIDNDGPNDLLLAIDEDVTASTKVITVPSGRSYASALAGSNLHYAVATGSAVFRFVLAGS